MVIHKRKKDTRQRGTTTHGWGSMKKHRGAGNRGGRGRSGSGARGDQKKPRYWKTEKFGKHGFKSKSRMPEMHPVNIKTVEDCLPTWILSGKAKKQADSYIINLADLGYNKLLGTGTSTLKLSITVDFASHRAVEKIQKAGGSVTVSNAPAESAEAVEESE
ncbi:uL15m family ribosomal protein [Nanoarchaeota archaeon]